MREALRAPPLAQPRPHLSDSQRSSDPLVCCAACAVSPPRRSSSPLLAPRPRRRRPPLRRRSRHRRVTSRCPTSRTCADCDSSRSPARTPRRTGRTAATELIMQSRRARRLRPDLPDAARRRRARGAPLVPVSSGKGRDDVLVLPARRPGGHLRVDQPAVTRARRSPDHSHGYVWALYDDYDIYGRTPTARTSRRLTDDAGYDAEGDGLRQGRLDRLHVGARRRHRSVPHGRRRQEREAADEHARLRRRRVLQRGLLEESCGARRVRSRARTSRTTSGCSRRTSCARRSSSSTSPNADGPTRARSRTSTRHRSRRSARRRSASCSRRTTAIRRGASSTSGAIDIDGTRLERITHAGGFDGFPMFSPDGKTLAFSSNRATPPGKHDTNVFVARLGRTADAHGGRPRARRRSRSLKDISLARRSARARAAASARRARAVRRVHRGRASRRSASSRPATRRLPPGVPGRARA